MATIGLAMIVKDASATVLKALASVTGICSQLLVVDTGSNDDTPQLCSNYGTEIHFFEWNGSFSDARNFSLKLMRTDWILVLDADEVLDCESFLSNLDIFDDKSIGGIRVEIQNILEESYETTIYRHRYTRLFRNLLVYDDNLNHKPFLFTGRIHEQIAESIEKQGYAIVDSNITIKHYGYSEKNQEKINRNKELLEQELAENPDDDWLKFHLAETEFSASRYDKAKDIYIKILESSELTPEQNEKIMLRLAQIALKEDNFLEIIRYTDFSSNDIDREGFRRFILGIAYLSQRDLPAADEELNSELCKNSCLVDKEQLRKSLDILNRLSDIL